MVHPSPLVRDVFQLKENNFTLPESTIGFDPKTKRALTICNLFVNHKLPISDIVRILDEDCGSIVLTLLEAGIIHERRRTLAGVPFGTERRRSFRQESSE